jgi:hypothetical protein
MTDKRPIVETVEQARQGVTGQNVWLVLLISCALAIALMGMAFVFVDLR